MLVGNLNHLRMVGSNLVHKKKCYANPNKVFMERKYFAYKLLPVLTSDKL